MKCKNLLLASVLFLGFFSANDLQALDHGSIKGKNEPMYTIRDGAAPGAAVNGLTLDFKLVTIGNKTWAWTNWQGKNISGNSWSSQLRFWQPTKLENNLTGRVAGTQQTYGTCAKPSQNPLKITFLQEENNAFFETADFDYNYTQQNSADASDTEAPVLAEPTIVSQTALALELSLSASDNSNDFFYYIVDEENSFVEVSFFNSVKLTLLPETAYNFSIYAVDFSGNMSNLKKVSTQASEALYFVEGNAQAISFKLDSRSLNKLLIECTSTSVIGDAFVKLTIGGKPIDGKEWKPTIAAAGTTTYQIEVPSNEVPGWAENAILGLNLGYIVSPIGDWGHYVVENSTITSGEHSGAPILHKIGTGTDIGEPQKPELVDCENNLFNEAVFTLGTPYFATGDSWTPSANYSANVSNNELNVSLGDATNLRWQAQFPILLDSPVNITAGKEYGIMMNVETSKNLPLYVKFMDNDDNLFLEISASSINVEAPETVLKSYKLVAPEGLSKISKILFDFGGNLANTSFKVSNIILCDQFESGSGADLLEVNSISIYQIEKNLYINAENELESISLYSLNGQKIPVQLNGNSIKLEQLQKGVYLLYVSDVLANQKVFKFIVK